MCRPDGAISTTGSGLHEGSDRKIATISDKWTVESLKDYLRKRGGRINSKKADLLERLNLAAMVPLVIIDNNFTKG